MHKLIIAGMAVAMLAVPSIASAKDVLYELPKPGTCSLGGQPGSVDIDKGIATFNVPENGSHAVIRVPQTNLKVNDIKRLSFKSNSSAAGMVYMTIVTDNNTRVTYTPAGQTPGVAEVGVGSWYSHDPMTSGVRVNDAVGNFPNITWAQMLSQVGNESVTRVSITAGCSTGFGTVQVDRIQVNNQVLNLK